MTMRNTYLVGFLIVVGLLSTSVYFQLVDGMTPCPLCTLQRITFGLLGMVFLAGIIWHRKYFNRLIINLSCLLTSCLGIFFAGRQVWLQNFPPPGNAECGASLQYMMQVLPVNEVIQKVFAGTAECTQRGFEFMHLNMAEWALVWFVGFLVLSICLFFEEFKWK